MHERQNWPTGGKTLLKQLRRQLTMSVIQHNQTQKKRQARIGYYATVDVVFGVTSESRRIIIVVLVLVK